MKFDEFIECATLAGMIIFITVIISPPKYQDSCKMYSEIFKKEINYALAGYYVPEGFYGNFKELNDEYFCIWTKDLSEEEVAGTVEHEKCHVLVDKNYKHFCEEPYEYSN